ncbi:hypothetical protein J6S88_05155 [bacterium]|nr:hypothetical protein [bacterium]
MIKVSKVKLFPNIRKPGTHYSKPKFYSVIKLAQFTGAEVSEKAKPSGTYNVCSLLQLQQKLAEIKEQFKEIAKEFSGITLSGKSSLLDLSKKDITQNILNKERAKRLLHKGYLRDIVNEFSNKVKVPYLGKMCSDVPTKQFFTFLNESMIVSPRLLVHYIKGENTVSHYENIRELKRIYSSCSVNELFRMKMKILKEFGEYTNTDSLIPDYKFSKAQMKCLKQLTAKYDAIDGLLKKHNIHTSAIEALFYSGIENCSKAGDVLPNKDIMLGFSQVYDRTLKINIPVILSFANTDFGYRFKAYRYDENLISNIAKYKKQVSHCIKTKNYAYINDLDDKIMKYLKTIEVSEVYAEPKDIAGMRKEMEKCPDMTAEKIDNVLNNSTNDIVYHIRNLQNFDVKRYYNTSIPLIKCLKEFSRINKINEFYTEALAFNNVRHSPVGMYIKYGFEPISVSKEEIEKALLTKAGFDFKRSVWLVYKM